MVDKCLVMQRFSAQDFERECTPRNSYILQHAQQYPAAITAQNGDESLTIVDLTYVTSNKRPFTEYMS